MIRLGDWLAILIALGAIALFLGVFIKVSRSLRKGGGAMTSVMFGATYALHGKDQRAALTSVIEEKADKKKLHARWGEPEEPVALEADLIERLARGIEYFNKEYFFEAHDTIEDLWMDARKRQQRDLFHGLVHMATGFYHYRMHNLNGMRSQLSKGMEKLSRLPAICLGCNIAKLCDESRPFLDAARQGQTVFPTTLPTIDFAPEDVRP